MRREIGAGGPPADHRGHTDDDADHHDATGHDDQADPHSHRPGPEDDALNKTGCS
jgi:hypothetical protein